MNGLVSGQVSFEKLRGRMLFQVKVHSTFVFCNFHPVLMCLKLVNPSLQVTDADRYLGYSTLWVILP